MSENQTPPEFTSFEIGARAEFMQSDGTRYFLDANANDLRREPIAEWTEARADLLLTTHHTISGLTDEGGVCRLFELQTEAYAREVLGTLSVGDDGATILIESYGELLETADALGWDSESQEHDCGYKRDEEGEWSDSAADALEEAAEEYIQSRGLKVVYEED
tara:strand:- start:35 stop:523 length:489 start_codon:yes stop_codon:yes gene_type:complete